jgi:hypothetical protein
VTFSGNSQSTNSSEEDSDVDHSDASKAQETFTDWGYDFVFLYAEVLAKMVNGEIKSMDPN